MNRVVIIGNGFDLAHSLPTRYEDFINWYWEQWGQRLRSYSGKFAEDMFCSFRLKENIGLAGWYLVWGYRYQILFKQYSDRELVEIAINDKEMCDFCINSVFFSRICEAIESKGWVDIEREYYNLLRDAVLRPENCNYTISELNCQLRQVQNLLAEYLSFVTSVEIKCDERIHQQIYGRIRKNDICISQILKYYDYVRCLIDGADNEYQRLLCRYGIDGHTRHYMTIDIKRLAQFPDATNIEDVYLKDLILPENILFLNFNYTGVADIYGTTKVSTVNHIHGDLSNPDSIIFGYGDELDDDYKELLKQTDKENLNNIKSIKYLESSNYRDLLRFIESAPYQVYIMGHSCGNSDRTLLNTLFEHKNCVSIKPYYYQKEDGSDNYMEIVQNICRNFTDMKLMRDRVVNKTFCEPLPQVKR
ncbi:MAG: hypothetical protein HDS51_02505 [Barnesiella sp.]|nr:hypothetical protein [Barnesiella sp.]